MLTFSILILQEPSEFDAHEVSAVGEASTGRDLNAALRQIYFCRFDARPPAFAFPYEVLDEVLHCPYPRGDYPLI